ncbi:MAG TPA: aldo/keto reductase [Polyangium sp.]|nr:aldo/keto reductase [Polyangium sp.]
MQQRPFGQTGILVSALGFGAGHIGAPDMTEDHAGTLLNRAFDRGINIVDTAPGYGFSEERIGRHLSWRRKEMVISTKGGYGVAGVPDWTGECIVRGVEQALERMRTDWIDIFHLHSCPLETLRREDILRALEDVVRSGKVKVAAYSGENEALAWAIESQRFGAIETSVNICDQRSLEKLIGSGMTHHLGVIAKRPLANAPWRFGERPVGHYAEVYWERLRQMDIDPGDLPWDELALRFAVFCPGVSTAIAGTASIQNLDRNIRMANRGPLPSDVFRDIRDAFRRHDHDWIGQI